MFRDNQPTEKILHVYKTMGESAFEFNPYIEDVYIHSNVRYIDFRQFAQCPNLRNVYIEEGPIAIYQYAFSGCEKLTNIRIPASIQFIEMGTFCQCTSLTSLSLGTGVIAVGDHLCTCCDRLEEIQIPPSSILISEEALEYTSIKKVVGAKGSCAQYYAQKYGFDFVANAVLGTNGVCGDGVSWSYSRENRELRISGSGKMWNYGWRHRAPWRVFQIESVVIDDNVQSIGEKAFLNCIFLRNLEIGKNVSRIAYNAFQSSGIPEQISIHPDNNYFRIEDGKIAGEHDTVSFSEFEFAKYVGDAVILE